LKNFSNVICYVIMLRILANVVESYSKKWTIRNALNGSTKTTGEKKRRKTYWNKQFRLIFFNNITFCKRRILVAIFGPITLFLITIFILIYFQFLRKIFYLCRIWWTSKYGQYFVLKVKFLKDIKVLVKFDFLKWFINFR
jgi:hypothetical protein